MTSTATTAAATSTTASAISQLDSRLANTIGSLEALLCEDDFVAWTTATTPPTSVDENSDGDDGVPPFVGVSVSRLAAKLAAIRTSLAHIRGCLDLAPTSPEPPAASGSEKAATNTTTTTTTTTPQFNAHAQVLVDSCGTVVSRLSALICKGLDFIRSDATGRLRNAAGALRNGRSQTRGSVFRRSRVDADQDAVPLLRAAGGDKVGALNEKTAPLAKVKLTFDVREDTKDADAGDLFARFHPLVDRLVMGFDVLLQASSFETLDEQQAFLGSSSCCAFFYQLQQDTLSLMAICQDTQESRLQSWRQRLAPRSLLPTSSRLNGLLARGRQASRPRSPRPKSQDDSLPRANTWPLLIKQRSQSLAVRQAAEARKRSAAINKQIAADFKGREESVLVWGDYEAIVLVVENFMAAASSSSRARSDSQASAAELDVDLEAAAVPIRRNVLLEARRFVESLLDVVEEHSDMEQAVGLVKRMKAKNATLDDKMVLSIEELWSSEAFRTACTAAGKPDAYAHLVMDAVRRISAENYMPTLADHRRFFQDRRRMMFKGTFKFKRLSVSLADMNCMSSGIKSVRSYFEDTTILLFLFDLSHCVELFDNDDESHHGEGRLRESLTLFEHLVNTRHFPQASMILVLWNVAGFKDKLDGKEPSSSLRINNRPDGESAAEQAINHVIDKFTAAKKSGMPLHTRVAELSDTAITTTILAIVKDAMLARMLTVSGVFRDKAST